MGYYPCKIGFIPISVITSRSCNLRYKFDGHSLCLSYHSLVSIIIPKWCEPKRDLDFESPKGSVAEGVQKDRMESVLVILETPQPKSLERRHFFPVEPAVTLTPFVLTLSFHPEPLMWNPLYPLALMGMIILQRKPYTSQGELTVGVKIGHGKINV